MFKQKILLLSLATLLVLIFCNGCLGKSLTDTDVSNFKVEYSIKDSNEFITISGKQNIHSALVLSKLEIVTEGDSINVAGELDLVSKNQKSLQLNLTFMIDKDVKKITFGDEEKVIWQR